MKKEIQILLVEDNDGDIILTLEALRLAKVTNGVEVVRDGESAIRYLKREGIFQNKPIADLVLLDINLPRVDGLEVLREIREDERLSSLPVVILTTSDSEKDVLHSYQLHASCYIVKPVDFQKFMHVVHLIKDFWIDIVKLPNIKR